MFTVADAAASLGHNGWAHTCTNGSCHSFGVVTDPYRDAHGVWCPDCGGSLTSVAPGGDPVEAALDDVLHFGDDRASVANDDGTVAIGFGVAALACDSSEVPRWAPVVVTNGRARPIPGGSSSPTRAREIARRDAARRIAGFRLHPEFTVTELGDLGQLPEARVRADVVAEFAAIRASRAARAAARDARAR